MKIGVFGCAGRMGRTILRYIINHSNECKLSGGCVSENNPFIETDLGILAGLEKIGKKATTDIEKLVKESDAIIDFTLPKSTLLLAALTSKHKTAHIIGTTGLTEEQKKQLKKYSQNTSVVHSHNMSVGINLLLGAVEQLSSKLDDDSCDIEIVEMHHRNKIDAPSGTALALGEAAAKGRNVSLDDVACYSREGETGIRPVGEIGFATLRGGGVIGDHKVIFAGEDERIEVGHKAENRSIFAHGAVRAALWTKDKDPGLYSMRDVLRL